jgi:hypothetical protein
MASKKVIPGKGVRFCDGDKCEIDFPEEMKPETPSDYNQETDCLTCKKTIKGLKWIVQEGFLCSLCKNRPPYSYHQFCDICLKNYRSEPIIREGIEPDKFYVMITHFNTRYPLGTHYDGFQICPTCFVNKKINLNFITERKRKGE